MMGVSLLVQFMEEPFNYKSKVIMSKKSSNPKKMGLVSGNKKVKTVTLFSGKLSRPENKTRKLPISGGTSLEDYALDVMILK